MNTQQRAAVPGVSAADIKEVAATVNRIATALGTCRPVIAMNALMIVVRGIADVEGVDTDAVIKKASKKK